MTFVNEDLDLVLFLNSRNRIKFNCRDAVRRYIFRRRTLYARKCFQENLPEKATQRKFKHILGLDKSRAWCGALTRPSKQTRDLTTEPGWSLAPNRYDVPSEIYANRKGAGGAHWAKVHTSKSILQKPVEKRTRYNINYYRKGSRWFFPTNARYRRPTLRFMVSSLQGCYKDPKDPGPTDYFPKNYVIEKNISPPIKSSPPNPHLFHRDSCVPVKLTTLVPRHISMDPAPGRYETRFIGVCACNPKLIYMPGLRLFIDQQKRNRFRGLPYERIKQRRYCDPEWRHVEGHGHRYLFKEHSKAKKELKLKAVPKGSENLRLKMFHDQRYLNLIQNPLRQELSYRQEPLPELPVTIHYNSLAKRVIRKQLRSNKKIAFNSGQERFKDGYRMPILTFEQQQAAKRSLPLERQLRDRPVLQVSLSQIKSRLHQTPLHMLPTFMPELRKRLFKFLPLPGAKVLVTEQDTRPEMVDGKYQCDNFYGREIIAENFFLDPSQRQQQQQPKEDTDHRRDDYLSEPQIDEPATNATTAATEADGKPSDKPRIRLSNDKDEVMEA